MSISGLIEAGRPLPASRGQRDFPLMSISGLIEAGTTFHSPRGILAFPLMSISGLIEAGGDGDEMIAAGTFR